MGMINAGATRNGIIAMKDKTKFILHAGDISYADCWNYAYSGIGSVNGGDVFNTYEGSWGTYAHSFVRSL
jgi:hypothetical protein